MLLDLPITDDQIERRLRQIAHATCYWCGHLPGDHADWDRRALEKARSITVADVRKALEDVNTTLPNEQIDAAISLAATPAGLPDFGCVGLYFEEE